MRCIAFDPVDLDRLRHNGFDIAPDNESAVVHGEIRVSVIRPDGDTCFGIDIVLPNGVTLPCRTRSLAWLDEDND